MDETKHQQNHERSDINVRYIGYFGVALALITVAVLGGAWILFQLFSRFEERRSFQPSLVQQEELIPPEPRLQTFPERAYQETLENQQQMLNRYEWLDREKGLARIPIGRAMDILAERGLPFRPESAGDKQP